MQPHQSRPRELRPQPRSQKLVKFAYAQGADGQIEQAFLGDGPLQACLDRVPLSRPDAHGDAESQWFHPPEDEFEDPRRRGVDPLEVVHGQDHWFVPGEGSEDPEYRK
jgi:hypothetical protein